MKDLLKGQSSRDVLIETLHGRIQELQQQIDEHKVTAVCVSLSVYTVFQKKVTPKFKSL